MHALALNTYVAPFDETTKVFHLLHLFVEVDFHPFVDDFHLETKVILDQKTFIWFVHHIFILVALQVWCMNFYEIVLSQMILQVVLTFFSKHVGTFVVTLILGL